MKKLLLAFSLLAAFGLGITATSITIPPNESIDIQDGDKKKEKKKKTGECCKKPTANNSSDKPSCCSKDKKCSTDK